MALFIETLGEVSPTKVTPKTVFVPGKLPVKNAFDVIRIASPALVNTAGQLDPAGAASQFFDTVTFATMLTPPVSFNVRDFADSKPSLVNQFLRPTVRLKGPAGEYVIQPYGPSTGLQWGVPLAVLGGLALLVGLKGRRRLRDRRRR